MKDLVKGDVVFLQESVSLWFGGKYLGRLFPRDGAMIILVTGEELWVSDPYVLVLTHLGIGWLRSTCVRRCVERP